MKGIFSEYWQSELHYLLPGNIKQRFYILKMSRIFLIFYNPNKIFDSLGGKQNSNP